MAPKRARIASRAASSAAGSSTSAETPSASWPASLRPVAACSTRVGVAREHDHPGAGAGEAGGERAADRAGAARHDGDAASSENGCRPRRRPLPDQHGADRRARAAADAEWQADEDAACGGVCEADQALEEQDLVRQEGSIMPDRRRDHAVHHCRVAGRPCRSRLRSRLRRRAGRRRPLRGPGIPDPPAALGGIVASGRRCRSQPNWTMAMSPPAPRSRRAPPPRRASPPRRDHRAPFERGEVVLDVRRDGPVDGIEVDRAVRERGDRVRRRVDVGAGVLAEGEVCRK